jgi:Arylsulfotransferase (ASST)
VAICLIVPGPRGTAAAASRVYVFPTPGSGFATSHTQISFRGLNVSQLGAIAVQGSSTGVHPGKLLGHSDGVGGSFVPLAAFKPGERVTVSTALDVVGGRHGSFHFRIAHQAPGNRSNPFSFAPRVRGDVWRFRSAPSLVPAAVRVLRLSSRTARGDFFLAPQVGPVSNGPMILDSKGKLIWFDPVPGRDFATDLRVQRYQGKPVLTWWHGIIRKGVGQGEAVIYDTAYRQVAAVRAANGLKADFHEFQLTRRGTALITSYHSVFVNARSVGGSRHQATLDGVVQEIDIPTGLVLFQWDSLDHVPLTGSHGPIKSPYNYFHINSIDQDADGNLIVSGRNTWSAYKVNHRTGATMWVLGGKHSTFRMGRGTQFAYQHDVRVHDRRDRVVSVYDDGGSPFVHHSRGITLRLDLRHRRVSLIRRDLHQPPLSAKFEGNLQRLPNGDDFVGWGEPPYFSEFNRRGRMIFDARFVGQNLSYRVWRFRWGATPLSLPALAAHTSHGRTTVWASWNGATDVFLWRVLGGPTPASLRPVGTFRKRNFETRMNVAPQTYIAVEALDGRGQLMSESTVRKVP